MSDPTHLTPAPPNISTWASAAERPPSPFPWSDAGAAMETSASSDSSIVSSLAAGTPSAATLTPPESPPKTTPAQAAKTPGLEPPKTRAAAPSLIALPVTRGLSAPPPKIDLGLGVGASPSSEGVRTPSGFEFLDWGEDLGARRGVQRSFDWMRESFQDARTTFRRRLGPTEVSYYLGSRGDGPADSGVNDMYLHIGFSAEPRLMTPARIAAAWATVCARHPLLTSRVEYGDPNNVFFVYDVPATVADVRAAAIERLSLQTGAADPQTLIAAYLNGPRTLSDERLSLLCISARGDTFADDSTTPQVYDFYLFSTHFIGDGMALHSTAHEFFGLLSADSRVEEGVYGGESDAPSAVPREDDDVAVREPALDRKVSPHSMTGSAPTPDSAAAADSAATAVSPPIEKMPEALETELETSRSWGRMAWAGARVDFNRTQSKLIGAQVFARAKRGARKTIVTTEVYDAATTKKILAKCKAMGVTISHAMFALSNTAYIRSTPVGSEHGQRNERLPCMLYSALNLRGNLTAEQDKDWYKIAIGYYNIILPSFAPRQTPFETTFWQRAREVRAQTSKAVKSKLLLSRAKLMALERERRSIGFEIEDERRREEKRAVGLGIEKLSLSAPGPAPAAADAVKVKVTPVADDSKTQVAAADDTDKTPTESTTKPSKKPSTPSLALMGLSMLGNLDGIYKHATYTGLELETLTTGSRQRPGALLLFAYTFAGRLFICLGYDSHGFKEATIESWWQQLLSDVQEFMV